MILAYLELLRAYGAYDFTSWRNITAAVRVRQKVEEVSGSQATLDRDQKVPCPDRPVLNFPEDQGQNNRHTKIDYDAICVQPHFAFDTSAVWSQAAFQELSTSITDMNIRHGWSTMTISHQGWRCREDRCPRGWEAELLAGILAFAEGAYCTR